MAPKPHNVGVVGYGMSAKVFHIPLILALPNDFKLYAIVQRSPQPEDDCSKDHSGIRQYHTTESMLADSAIEIVVVTTTPSSHFDICQAALQAGKHVIVEKPFTPTSKEARQLVNIAKKNKKHLTVYQNRRWDTDFLTLSHLVHTNTLGRVVDFSTHFDRHRPLPPPPTTWKSKPLPGGGAIYDLGTHLIDQVVVLFGLPERITAFVGPQREGYAEGQVIDDSCTVLLHYDSKGLLATVRAGVVSPELAQLRYWVRGEKGSYKKCHLDSQEDQLKAGMRPGDAGFGVEDGEKAGTLTTQRGGEGELVQERWPNVEPVTYRVFYEKFAEAVEERGEVPVEPEGVADVIRLIELAKLSSREGRTIDVGRKEGAVDD